MTRTFISIAALCAAGLLGSYAIKSASAPARAETTAVKPSAMSAADAAHPAVLELYQSQGCSSCPPANAVLNAIADRPDVLALSFAVTYWDQLGWKDRFAQPAFTARQWDYSHAQGRANVQTPQLIVNGRGAVLGSRRSEVEQAIGTFARPKNEPAITAAGGQVDIAAAPIAKPAIVWLVSYDPRIVAVPIRAGENSGRTLPHRNIVKQLVSLGSWSGKAAHFPAPAAPAGLSRAVIVQSGKGGPIVAAARI